MSNRLDTILCEVSEMPRSVTFYKAILGREPSIESAHWTSFPMGDVSLALHPRYSSAEASGGGWVIGIRVASLTDVKGILAAFSREPGREHEIPGGKLLEFTDPDGNRIQAIERS